MKLVTITLAIAAVGCRGGGDVSSPSTSPEEEHAAVVAETMRTIDAAAGISIDAGVAAPRDRHALHAALERGRAQARHHDWREAVASFEAAVAASPDDARALSELGWAAFRAGDLDRAAQASAAAAASPAASAKVKAASLYNLGRVQEARGDRDAAATAYRASLALRRNRVVRRHLRAIDRGHGHAPATADPIDADAPDDDSGMVGPFASIAAYCDAQAGASADDDDDDGASAVCAQGSGLAAGPDHLDAPELRVIGMRGDVDDVTCLLALHAKAGWYLWDGIPCATTTAAGTDWAASISLDAPAPGRVLARFAIGIAVRDSGHGHHACSEVAVACAISPDAKPACTAAVPIAWAASCPDAPSSGAAPAIHWDVSADATLDGDALVVGAPAPARAAPDGLADVATGTFALR